MTGLELAGQLSMGLVLGGAANTISAGLSEPRDAIEDIVEPYMIQQGFLQRTPRGRLLTPKAFEHLGLAVPDGPTPQMGLFAGDESEGP